MDTAEEKEEKKPEEKMEEKPEEKKENSTFVRKSLKEPDENSRRRRR